MHLIQNDIVLHLYGDGTEFSRSIVDGRRHTCARHVHPFSVQLADTAGMNEIMASLIVLTVAYVAGEEFGASLFSVLPYLLDRHVVRVDVIDHTAGEVILRVHVVFLLLGAPVAVVEAHDIAVWKHHAGVLLILPVEVPADRFEEILLHILRPAGRITDDPVQLPGLKITVDDDILMASGEGERIRLLVVPYRIIMEPVVCILASGAADRVNRKHVLMIPFL